MKKLLLLLSCALFLSACDKDETAQPIFVTGVEMPSPERVFAPGDEVTVKAQGLETGDDILFEIRWPLSGEAVSEGFSRGVYGVVTQRSQSAITFLAPGGYPAGEADVMLFRQGRAQKLGTISLSDGQPPKEFSLYAISRNTLVETTVSRIDMTSGEISPAENQRFFPALACAVNMPGTNCIYGVTADGSVGYYDLTMRYFRDSGSQNVLTLGVSNDRVALFAAEDNIVRMGLLSTTRANVIVPPSWELPEGIEPGMLAGSPAMIFTETFGQQKVVSALFAADRGDGIFVPMLMVVGGNGGNAVLVMGEPVEAEAMIPFRCDWPVETGGEKKTFRGFAVAQGGTTELRLFDAMAMEFAQAPLVTVPGTVRSLAVLNPDPGTLRIYMLCDTAGASGRIVVYDAVSGALTTLCPEIGDAELVLAR